jgi:hypothetical protein
MSFINKSKIDLNAIKEEGIYQPRKIALLVSEKGASVYICFS